MSYILFAMFPNSTCRYIGIYTFPTAITCSFSPPHPLDPLQVYIDHSPNTHPSHRGKQTHLTTNPTSRHDIARPSPPSPSPSHRARARRLVMEIYVRDPPPHRALRTETWLDLIQCLGYDAPDKSEKISRLGGGGG